MIHDHRAEVRIPHTENSLVLRVDNKRWRVLILDRPRGEYRHEVWLSKWLNQRAEDTREAIFEFNKTVQAYLRHKAPYR